MAAAAASPAFSVVVAAFNSAARIAETLNSVLDQTRPELELIVVDDGSSDRTAAVAEELAAGDRRIRVLRQSNRGTVAARNAGLAAARGEYVSFLDDDDLWLPDYLEAVAARLERGAGVGLVHTDAWVLDAASGGVGRRTALERFALPVRRSLRAAEPAAAEAALLRVNFVTTCAATVSRPALDAVGELDPSIRGCDDWDLWLRIAGAGFGVACIEEPLAVLRKRSDSVGSDRSMMAANSRLVLERALRRGPATPRARRIARRHLRLVAREADALRGASRPVSALAGIARRLGRKRIPLRPGGSRPTPAVVQQMLDRVGR